MVDVTTKHMCGKCGSDYVGKLSAENCCEEEKKEIDYSEVQEFTVTEHHLKLAKNFYISWNDCESGSPTIDPKRPYGDSDLVDSMAEVLGIEKNKDNFDDEDEEFWTDEFYDKMQDLHKQMLVVVQIIFCTGRFEVGKYKKEDEFSSKWERTL